MGANILMLILTVAGSGPYSAAFVNTQTMADCERRAAVVQAILQTGDTKVERIACRPSAARFEPFAHGEVQGTERRHYRLRIDDARITVDPLAPGQPCQAAEIESVYCATSGQGLLKEGR